MSTMSILECGGPKNDVQAPENFRAKPPGHPTRPRTITGRGKSFSIVQHTTKLVSTSEGRRLVETQNLALGVTIWCHKAVGIIRHLLWPYFSLDRKINACNLIIFQSVLIHYAMFTGAPKCSPNYASGAPVYQPPPPGCCWFG